MSYSMKIFNRLSLAAIVISGSAFAQYGQQNYGGGMPPPPPNYQAAQMGGYQGGQQRYPGGMPPGANPYMQSQAAPGFMPQQRGPTVVAEHDDQIYGADGARCGVGRNEPTGMNGNYVNSVPPDGSHFEN